MAVGLPRNSFDREVVMTKEQFLRSVESIANLTTNSLTGKERFNYASDWDSLAIIAFLSFADKEVGAQVSIADLKNCGTYNEVYQYLMSISTPQSGRLAS
jgi:acyl carrier protein